MDADDFSEMAYDILVRASAVSGSLKVELGAMSQTCVNEDDWLRNVQRHCREIIAAPDAYVVFWNLDDEEGLTAAKISDLANILYDRAEIILSTKLENRNAGFSG
jgi:hypothetical protein